jgi:Na+/phosphate symporter
MISRELVMYGCYAMDIDFELEESTSSKEMYAMSILSDAQHVMAHGDTETARQFINKAKYVISKVMRENKERV